MIDIVRHRLSIGRQKWPCRIVIVEFKIVTNKSEMKEISVCCCLLQVTFEACILAILLFKRGLRSYHGRKVFASNLVCCIFSYVNFFYHLSVVGCRLSCVDAFRQSCLSVVVDLVLSVVAKHFHCRCPDLLFC